MRRQDILLKPLQDREMPLITEGARECIVEIGFGNGEFLAHLAREKSEASIYGIEISITCVEKAMKRVLKENLSNVSIIKGDARYLLREYFGDSSVDKIYMSFPCPWPKERHERRRVTSEGFSGTISSILKMEGTFELATDEKWYADEVAEILSRHPALELIDYKVNKRRAITTKYERKWLEEGKDTFFLVFKKIDDFTVKRLIDGGNSTMHVKILNDLFNSDILSCDYMDISEGEGNSHWAFKKVYANRDSSWLVQTVTSDEDFEQKFYLKVEVREEDTIVKQDGTGLPYLTPSVREAIASLAKHLTRS